MEPIVASAAALIGVCLGAVLQWFFSRHEGRESRLAERRAEAYSRFLIWDRAGLDDKSIQEACRARTFIAAYGSRETIRAIADYERLGGVACAPDQKAAFTRMFNALRADRGLPGLEEEDLLTVMYLNDQPDGNAAPQRHAPDGASRRR